MKKCILVCSGAWICGIVLAMGGASETLAQTASPCHLLWNGFNPSKADADIAVGRNQVLIADHDYFKLFNRCGNQLGFVSPLAPVCLIQGLPHTGEEGQDPCEHQGFFWGQGTQGFQQNPTTQFGDERVIYDRITQRYFAIASGFNAEGLFIGVSEVQEADTWTEIRNIVPEDLCPSDGALHRGSISTWIDPSTPGGSLLWFIGEVQQSSCNGVNEWYVCKVDVNGLVANVPDPDAWWREGAVFEYVFFNPTVARRITQDSMPQYAIGANISANTLELLAFRADETPQGALQAPHRFTIPLGPGTPYPAFTTLPIQLPATGDPIRTYPTETI